MRLGVALCRDMANKKRASQGSVQNFSFLYLDVLVLLWFGQGQVMFPVRSVSGASLATVKKA